MDVKVRGEGCYRFGRFVLNSAPRELLRDGEPVAVTHRLFETLLVFLANPDRILTKDELLEAIWPGRYIEESSLTQAVYTLRKLLEGDGEAPYIVTAPGRGYKFVVPVERFGAADPFPLRAVKTEDAAPRGRVETAPGGRMARNKPRVAFIALAATLALVVAGALAVWWVNRTPEVPAKAKTIVVADFQNLTNDPALGTVLGRVLQIELAQSPYLNLLSQQNISETLQQMERPKEAPLTPALAQEVCARNQGDDAVSGTVARMGARYIVTLEAKDCAQGTTILATNANADREDDLPGALDGMIRKTRQALSESAESIRRFDVPILQATTSSFAALKVYSLGERLRAQGNNSEAMLAFKHAIELDPSFALAWLELGNCYLAAFEFGTANEAYRKAFAFRAHATEYQRFLLTGMYYSHLGNWVDGVKTYRLWTQTYPNDWLAWSMLATQWGTMAHYRESAEAGRVALRLNPNHYRPYTLLAHAYLNGNRFSDVKAVAALAIRKHLDRFDIHHFLYLTAYVEGDARTMTAQVEKEKGQPTEPAMVGDEARAAATSGQLKQSETLFAQAIALERPQGSDYLEEVAGFYRDEIEAVNDLASREEALKIAGTMTAAEKTDLEVHAMARLGEFALAKSQAEERAARSPDNGDAIELESTLAEIDLAENRPSDAIAVLQPAVPYELWDFETPALLGRAWLALGSPEKAAGEYRKILDNRGVDPNSPLYPLAYLGLARALHMEHRDAESQAAYKELFAFWKDADSDLPVLVQAKAEYAKLQSPTSSLPRG